MTNYKKYNDKKKVIEKSIEPTPEPVIESIPTDAEYLASILKEFGLKDHELVDRVGMGTVTLIKSILSGKFNLIHPYKTELNAWVKRQRRMLGK